MLAKFQRAYTLLSIIIPHFDNKLELGITLESIRKSNLFNLVQDVIVQSASHVEPRIFESEKVQIINESDEGIYDAINKGISASRGRYILVLGCGDTLLSVDQEQFRSFQNLLTLCAPLILFDIVVSRNKNEKLIKLGSQNPVAPSAKIALFHQAILMSRDAYNRYGPYDTTLKIHADYLLCLKIWQKENITTQMYPITTFSQMGVSGFQFRGLWNRFREMRYIYSLNSFSQLYLYYSYAKLLLRIFIERL